MKCFYHNDNDGIFSAACVDLWANRSGNCEFISMDYKDPFPFDTIKDDEKVWIVDYSIPPEEMDRLLVITPDVTWIDHHVTAIEKYAEWKGVVIKGERDIRKAACELTWEYCVDTNHHRKPLALVLVGDRDNWTWKFGDDTKCFHAGIQLYDLSPQSEFLKILLCGLDETERTKEVIHEGRAIEIYRTKFFKRYRDTYGFDCIFLGYNCRALNLAMCGSECFGEEFKKYEIVIPFVWDGDKFTVSLFSDKKVDVSEIAKQYGGGGHKYAAGFVCDKLPFMSRANADKLLDQEEE